MYRMTNISITEARGKLPKLADEVYFKGKTFTLTKSGVPVLKMIRVDKKDKRRKFTSKDREDAIKNIAGIWKDRWKGKTTEEVLQIIRKKAWRSHAY